MALILNEASHRIHLTAIGSDAGSNRFWCIETFCLPHGGWQVATVGQRYGDGYPLDVLLAWLMKIKLH